MLYTIDFRFTFFT